MSKTEFPPLSAAFLTMAPRSIQGAWRNRAQGETEKTSLVTESTAALSTITEVTISAKTRGGTAETITTESTGTPESCTGSESLSGEPAQIQDASNDEISGRNESNKRYTGEEKRCRSNDNSEEKMAESCDSFDELEKVMRRVASIATFEEGTDVKDDNSVGACNAQSNQATAWKCNSSYQSTSPPSTSTDEVDTDQKESVTSPNVREAGPVSAHKTGPRPKPDQTTKESGDLKMAAVEKRRNAREAKGEGYSKGGGKGTSERDSPRPTGHPSPKIGGRIQDDDAETKSYNSGDTGEDSDILLQEFFDLHITPSKEKLSRTERAIKELEKIAYQHFMEDEENKRYHLFEFRRYVKSVNVVCFGSQHNGTYINSSDLDVALVVELCSLAAEDDRSRSSHLPMDWSPKVLTRIRDTITSHDKWKVKECLTKISVPILKVTFENELVVDIMFRQVHDKARERDNFIKAKIEKADPIVAQLCMCVKHWAKIHDFNSAWHGGLNSVSWIMLVLCFVRQFHHELLAPKKRKQDKMWYSLSHMLINFLQFTSLLSQSGEAFITDFLVLYVNDAPFPSLYISDCISPAPGAHGRIPQNTSALSHNLMLQIGNMGKIRPNMASSLLPHIWGKIATRAGRDAWAVRSGPTTVRNIVPVLFNLQR